jgi:hypothetical protein
MNMLNQTGNVYRAVKSKVKSYVTNSDRLIGTYPCRISRSSVQTIKGSPNTVQQGQMRAYFNTDADVRDGDRLECDGRDYNIMFVYKPNNHHLEVDLSIVERDV